jgi:hemolysin activation/secretion protein
VWLYYEIYYRRILLLFLFPIFACTTALARPDSPVLKRLIFAADCAAPAIAADFPAAFRPAVDALAASVIGQTPDDTMLQDIPEKLREIYESNGHPFVSIGIQRLDAAVVCVSVSEIRLGRIIVEGNRWVDREQYSNAISIPPNGPIDLNTLAADTAWIGRNGDRQAVLRAGPGSDPSVYDLTIQAKDEFPLTFSLTADNAGATDTGLYHTGVGFAWTDAFWRGDRLDYGLLLAPGPQGFLGHSVAYTTWLPSRDSITIAGSLADIHGEGRRAQGGGHADSLSIRYSMNLPAFGGFSQDLDFGFDYKTTNTNVLFGGTSVFATTADVDQFIITYGVRWFGVTASVALVGSPGRMTPGNTSALMAMQQPGATATYAYTRANAERVTPLPFGTTWDVKLTGQYSTGKLLPSEQLEFGGVHSIRGFMDWGATRDNGVLIQNELRLPGQDAGRAGFLVPFALLDMGAGVNADPMATRRSGVEMMSTGAGVAWEFGASSVRLSWGIPLVRNGHTGPTLGPQFSVDMKF